MKTVQQWKKLTDYAHDPDWSHYAQSRERRRYRREWWQHDPDALVVAFLIGVLLGLLIS